MKRLIILLTIFIFGCATNPKTNVDHQLAKGEIKTLEEGELTGIKDSVNNLESEVSAQAGAFNEITRNIKDIKAGRDSIINDPDMINKFIIVFGLVIGLPFIGLLIIMGIYIVSSEKKHKITNEHMNKLIEAIHNDPNLTK